MNTEVSHQDSLFEFEILSDHQAATLTNCMIVADSLHTLLLDFDPEGCVCLFLYHFE